VDFGNVKLLLLLLLLFFFFFFYCICVRFVSVFFFLLFFVLQLLLCGFEGRGGVLLVCLVKVHLVISLALARNLFLLFWLAEKNLKHSLKSFTAQEHKPWRRALLA
jgi:hypothetical protein